MNRRDVLFQRANERWESGKLNSAFRLFLAAAKAGDTACQVNLGTFYIDGIGIKPNRDKGLYWYKRAYRKGRPEAAHNIAIVFRDEGNKKEALRWFERAVSLGLPDSHLDIAKLLLDMGDLTQPVSHLRRVTRSRKVQIAEGTKEEAAKLLNRISRRKVSPE